MTCVVRGVNNAASYGLRFAEASRLIGRWLIGLTRSTADRQWTNSRVGPRGMFDSAALDGAALDGAALDGAALDSAING